ncbi:DUF4062 domain-containing protein [Frankia umida]|uniref:WD40 domain-containing protein n=1 Tax=Frankia umida TaxID=573489 RepID=UPI0027E40836|nr:DUF4062 domain-containing protein [Frankia umida]
MSHTSELAEYPQARSFVRAAVEAVLRSGMRPVQMAQFPAGEQSPAEYCRQQVRTCDVYLAVVGFRYGSLVPDNLAPNDPMGVSYTELEFRTATAAGLPRLVFLLDENAMVPRGLMDRNADAVDGFRERLRQSNVVVRAVSTPDELGEAVLQSLYELRTQLPAQAVRVHPSGHGEGAVRGGVTAQSRPWMAPPLDRMVQRPELGDQLIDALLATGPVDPGRTTVLVGAGGFGKTTLATWAARHEAIDRRFPGGLLWVTLGQQAQGADLAGRINDLAFVLAGRRPEISDPDAAGAELGRLLDDLREPVLLVVDDAWDAAQLRPFRYGGRACSRLVTTRVADALSPDWALVMVDVMSEEQARMLVVDRTEAMATAVADRLARAAGRWPVLLNLVNGMLRRQVERGRGPDRAAEDVLDMLATYGPAALDPARPETRDRAVAATIEASLNLLTSPDRERYLSLAVFPEDVDIPLDVLALLWPGCRVDVLCENLAGLGLVADYRLDPSGPRLILHDVIRAYLRQHVQEESRVHARLVDAAAELLSEPAEDGCPAWWTLPDEPVYLWRYLSHHLAEAGRRDALVALVADLRWTEAKTRQMGTVVGVDADLALAATELTSVLAMRLRQSAHLMGPIDPPNALGAILASRLYGLPELGSMLDRYRAALARPRFEPAWPPPDLPDHPAVSPPTGHAGGIYSCALSPDGSILATVSDDGTVRIWDLADMTVRAVLTGHTAAIWRCTFSPDGTSLATAGNDGVVRLWDVESGATRSVLSHRTAVTCCAFSPDGTALATTDQNGIVRLWGVADDQARWSVEGHSGGAWSCAFAPDGRWLATAGGDRLVRIWNSTDGTPAGVLSGHRAAVRACSISPDGTLIATVSDDQTARLWDLTERAEKAVLTGHSARLWECVFSPDGQILATGGHDGTARLWNVFDATEHAALPGHDGAVRGCAFLADSRTLITAGHDQTIRVWNVADASLRFSATGRISRMNRCAFSPDGTLLAASTANGAARVIQVSDRTEIRDFDGQAGGIRGCAFSPDGRLLATTGNDGTTRLWEIRTGEERLRLRGHTGWVRNCAFSPDGVLLAACGHDRTTRLWQVTDGVLVAVLAGHQNTVHCCDFSPDGTVLATCSEDRTTRLWNVSDGTERAQLIGHTDAVTACAFSPDGSLLATTSDDMTVRLWRVGTGEVSHVLTGHTHWVETCAFSPDGTVLATAGSDGVIRLWNVTTGTCHCALRVTGPLVGVAWHPTGALLAAAGGAGIHLLTYLP